MSSALGAGAGEALFSLLNRRKFAAYHGFVRRDERVRRLLNAWFDAHASGSDQNTLRRVLHGDLAQNVSAVTLSSRFNLRLHHGIPPAFIEAGAVKVIHSRYTHRDEKRGWLGTLGDPIVTCEAVNKVLTPRVYDFRSERLVAYFGVSTEHEDALANPATPKDTRDKLVAGGRANLTLVTAPLAFQARIHYA